MEEKKWCVYKHTAPNGKIYIGITSQSTSRRWREGDGYKNNIYFYRAIQKYGWKNIRHEIIENFLTEKQANLREIYYINQLKSNNPKYGYNIRNGGNAGKLSEETKDKLSNIAQNRIIEPRNVPMYMLDDNCNILREFASIKEIEKEIETDDEDESHMVCGIDDRSSHIGIAIIQKCLAKNKVIFKGTIEQRQDVKHLMDIRRGYRRYHRQHKRYRQARFNNRSSSKREGRLAPSIKQKKDAILRVLYQLNKWINIQEYHLEDVAIDIRAMTDDYKPYKWQYQRSNRLDENLRKAAILRDNCKCQECGKQLSRQIKIYQIYNEKGVSCPCSNGISFPNKIIYFLFVQLYNQNPKIVFTRELYPEWCKFTFKNKIRRGFYDLYFELDEKRFIVEMDGALGHGIKRNKTIIKKRQFRH